MRQIRRIQANPSPGLSELAAIYTIWKANNQTPEIVFSPITAAAPKDTFVIREVIDWKVIKRPKLNREERERLEALISYCVRADQMSLLPEESKYGSLKWSISRLRENLTGAHYLLWEAFMILADRILQGFTGLLVSGSDIVLSQDSRFRQFLEGDTPSLSQQGISLDQLGTCLGASYEGELNLTNLIFERTPAVLYLFRNPRLGSAGIVVRSSPWRPEIDLNRVRQHLPLNENWVLHPSGNILICGGRTAPQNRTAVSLDALKDAVRKRFL